MEAAAGAAGHNAEGDAVAAGIPLAEAQAAHEVATVGAEAPEHGSGAEGPVGQAMEGGYPADASAHLAAADHLAEAYQQQVDYQAYYQEQYQHADGGDAEDDPAAVTGLYVPSAEATDHPQQLTVADVNAMAEHTEGEWTAEEEQELLQVLTDEQYRAEKMGGPWASWSLQGNRFAPVAAYMKRTIRDVRQKVQEKLPEEMAAALAAAAAAASVAAQQPAEGHEGGPPHDPAATHDPAAGADDAAPGLPQHTLPMVAGHEQAHQLGGAADLMAGLGYHMPHEHLHMAQQLSQEQLQQMTAMTAEQLAAYQQQAAGIPLAQFQLAGQLACSGGEGTAQGLPADGAAYPGALEAHLLAQHMAAAAAAPFPIPLPVAPAHRGNDGPNPRNDRVFWKADEQHNLLRLVGDPAYRLAMLGTTELNWDAIAKHLGRGKRSVQRKYDNLKGSLAEGGAPGAAPLPSNDGKKWSPEEVQELLALVENEDYRRQRLNLDKVDWRVFGQHFGRSYESVSYKYSYIKNTGRTGQEGKAKHAKAKHDTSYKEMAIYALNQLAARTGVAQGTSGEICAEIKLNPMFEPQLDTAIVSGKKTLQRWKHGVRSALNAFHMFIKTGAVRDGEVVWQLDGSKLAEEQANQAAKASRTRAKPMSGAARRKMKKTGPGESGGEGEAEAEEAGEEGAHEALAAMMSSQRPPSARLAAKRKPGSRDSDWDDDDEGGKERAPRKKKGKAKDGGTAANGTPKPGDMAAMGQALHGLAMGPDGAFVPAALSPEMFAVLPLMMQPPPTEAQAQAAMLATFTPQQQQDYMASLTPEQQEALAEQQAAAAAAGRVATAAGDAAAAAPAAAPAAAAATHLQPWLAQMAWPPAAPEQAPLSAEVQQAQAAVAAAFLLTSQPAAQAPAAAPAAAGTADAAAAPPHDPATLTAADLFAAAEAAAAEQRAAAAAAAAAEAGTEPAAPAQEVDAGQALAEGLPAEAVVGLPVAEAAGEAGGATAPPDAPADGGAAPAAGAADAAASAEQQMADLQAYLAGTAHAAALEGGGGGGEHLAHPHFAGLDAAQQHAFLAAQHGYEAHDQQLYHHHDGTAAAAELPFDPSAVFAAQGHPAQLYDPGQYAAEGQQYDTAQQYHHADPGQYAAAGELAQAYGSGEVAHGGEYHGQHYAAQGEHAQHYAAAEGQQYEQQYGEGHQQYGEAHQQYDQQYAEHGQAYSAEQQAAYAEQHPYSAEQQAAYAAEHGQAYAAEGGQAYAAEHGQAYSAEHGQAYSAEHGQAYSGEHGQAYSAEHEQAYAAEHGQAYSGEHGQAYSGEGHQQQGYSGEGHQHHPEAYTAEQYAAYAAQQGGYADGGGGEAAGYEHAPHDAAAYAAADPQYHGQAGQQEEHAAVAYGEAQPGGGEVAAPPEHCGEGGAEVAGYAKVAGQGREDAHEAGHEEAEVLGGLCAGLEAAVAQEGPVAVPAQ